VLSVFLLFLRWLLQPPHTILTFCTFRISSPLSKPDLNNTSFTTAIVEKNADGSID
jgi:hypothetical protein